MKMEVDIITVSDGQITELKINEQLYTIKAKEQSIPEQTIDVPTEELSPYKKKGFTIEHQRNMGVHYIGTCDGMRIIKELVEELDGVFHETKRKFIIKKYYPVASDSSLKRYSITYASYLKGKPVVKKTRKYRRHRRRKPTGAHGRDKPYQTWIMNDEIDAVKRAINRVEYGYVPTTKAISEKTGFSLMRTRAVLHYMKTNEIAKSKRTSKNVVWRTIDNG